MALIQVSVQAYAEVVSVADLDLSKTTQDYKSPGIHKSVEGNPLRIGGQSFSTGIGAHARGRIAIDLKKSAQRFTAMVGVDDEQRNSPALVEFRVIGDGKLLWESGIMKGGDPAKAVSVDLTGVSHLILSLGNGGDDNRGNHGDWASAEIQYEGAKPETTVKSPDVEAVILTPKPAPQPAIHGPTVFGVRPKSPFLFRIPATGERPMAFSAKNLPDGLKLDATTGIITGSVSKEGEYHVLLGAKNARGSATRDFKITVGAKIALTPPMGWNSWTCAAWSITQEKVTNTAKAMVESGLVDHGYTYVNIDDFWSVRPAEEKDLTLKGPERSPEGGILPNARFPDIKGMVDGIHSLGLKAGIYSSPGTLTCGKCIGSYQHDEQDAKQFANWGIDYLKFDWCTYTLLIDPKVGLTQEVLKKPYKIMGDALAKQNRDIFYSLCYAGGPGKPWEWGASVGANCWRTGDDIVDSWKSIDRNGFAHDMSAPGAGPGHWNDPDSIVIGKVGMGRILHSTKLNPNEQYTHVSLWCLLAAPLLIGGDITQLDEFTLSLLTNDEVLDVDQDVLGKQATRLPGRDELPVYTKPLADGSIAVGLFNRGDYETTLSVDWKALGVSGSQTVRDLWRQKDLGIFADGFKTAVPSHGVVFVRVFPSSKR